MTPFSKKVIEIISAIPRGKVATYGQVAALAGNPKGSRGVSWILHSAASVHQLPWQRVINAKGKISFPWGTTMHLRQKTLLKKEGIVVSDNGEIDLNKFGL